MDSHTIVKGYFLGMMALGIIGNISLIGKERKPLTPGVTAFMTPWSVGHMALLYKFL